MAFGDGLEPQIKCRVCAYLRTLEPAERQAVAAFIDNEDYGHKAIVDEAYREHKVVLSASTVARHRRPLHQKKP